MPTSPIVTHDGAEGPIFGRERELAVLDELVNGLPECGAALLVRARRASVSRHEREPEGLYEGAPHGFTGTHKDQLNADLLEFLGE
jgi:hypothetical protein